MLFINHLDKNKWWIFDRMNMKAFNYLGGYNFVRPEQLEGAVIFECENWRELYLAKHYCPLEEDKWEHDVWISPDGRFYKGDAHEVMAGYLCEIIYGMDDVIYGGDELESRGWIRATTSLMWEIRFDEWKKKRITQKQYDALYDWCTCHNMEFPSDVNIK